MPLDVHRAEALFLSCHDLGLLNIIRTRRRNKVFAALYLADGADPMPLALGSPEVPSCLDHLDLPGEKAPASDEGGKTAPEGIDRDSEDGQWIYADFLAAAVGPGATAEDPWVLALREFRRIHARQRSHPSSDVEGPSAWPRSRGGKLRSKFPGE